MSFLRTVFLTFCSVICIAAHGQHYSQLGRFSVPYAKACAPVTVNVTSLVSFGNAAITYYYETSGAVTIDTFYTYTEPGIYKIVQAPAIDVDPKTDTLIFEVLPPTPPQFDVYQCTGSEIQVEVPDTVYDYYVVKFTDQDSVIYDTSLPAPSFDYGTNSGRVQVIGYYENAYTNCGDAFYAFNIAEPEEVTINAASLLQGCRDQFILDLEVATTPMLKYEVEFQQDGQFQRIHLGSIPTGRITLPVDFNPSEPAYCVRISSLNACSNTAVNQASLCQNMDLRSLSPLYGAYASYENNGVKIEIQQTIGDEILLFRRPDNQKTHGLITAIDEPYLDPVPSLMRSYEYKLVQQDTCGNKVDSLLLEAPFIMFLDKNSIENTVTISSKDPTNTLGSYEKSIIIYNPDSTTIVQLPYDNLITLAPEVGNTQHIRTMYRYSDTVAAFSNELIASYETTIFVPRAFTPNGDGMNDELQFFGIPNGYYEVTIFSRWGEVIHQVQNDEYVWNGRINGEPAPAGTYRYKIDFTLSNGELKTQVGTFVLLR